MNSYFTTMISIAVLAVMGLTLCLLLLGLYVLIADQGSPGDVFAGPEPISCDQVLPLVHSSLERSCRNVPGHDSACYGNRLLQSDFYDPGFSPSRFDEPGDITELSALRSLQSAPYDPATGNWGLGVLRLRALLEGTIAGEVVTVVLYGDTSLEAAAEGSLPATGSIASLSAFPAFYFSTRAGTVRDCNLLPQEGGLLIDTPDNLQVRFVANGVEIMLGSTALLYAENAVMRVILLDGAATVTVNTVAVTLQPMQEVRIALDSSGHSPLGLLGPASPVNASQLSLNVLCPIAASLGLSFPCSSLRSASPTPLPTASPAPSLTPATAFVAAYALSPDQGLSPSILSGTLGTFFASTAANICMVQWIVWENGVEQIRFNAQEAPRFTFYYTFTGTGSADVWAYPYACGDPMPLQGLAQGFTFAVQRAAPPSATPTPSDTPTPTFTPTSTYSIGITIPSQEWALPLELPSGLSEAVLPTITPTPTAKPILN